MIIGSTKELPKNETRTPLTPQVVKELNKLGHTVILEKNMESLSTEKIKMGV